MWGMWSMGCQTLLRTAVCGRAREVIDGREILFYKSIGVRFLSLLYNKTASIKCGKDDESVGIELSHIGPRRRINMRGEKEAPLHRRSLTHAHMILALLNTP